MSTLASPQLPAAARLLDGDREPASGPLRVALFHNLPPGGALRALYEVVRRFPEEVEVDLFVVEQGAVDRFTSLAEGTYRLDLTGVVSSTRRYSLPGALTRVASHLGRITRFVLVGEGARRAQRRMAREINFGGYDVAFLHACQYSLSVPIATWLEVPCVFYAQEPRRVNYEARPGQHARVSGLSPALTEIARRSYESLQRRRDRRAIASADAVLCNSRFSAEALIAAYGIDPVVCYLGVDSDRFTPGPSSRLAAAHSDSVLRVASVGALHPVKGHDLALVGTALAARQLGMSAELHVAYERERPGYASELEHLAASLGVGLILRRGVSDDELVALFRAAVVTVCAARLEPFGLTPLESMSCGTPVVAVAQGGFRETVVDGLNGYLVERDAASLAAGIVDSVSGRLDITGEDLHEHVRRRWGWDRSVERILAELRRAADSATGSTDGALGAEVAR